MSTTRISGDKYYTPIPIANHCWEVTLKTIGEDRITQVIEPSAGGVRSSITEGVFRI